MIQYIEIIGKLSYIGGIEFCTCLVLTPRDSQLKKTSYLCRTGGKLIFSDRSQPDQLPFAESTSFPEGLSSASEELEPEKTEL